MDRKPMQPMKERGDMIKFGTTKDESSSMVLNFQEFFNELGVLENQQAEHYSNPNVTEQKHREGF